MYDEIIICTQHVIKYIKTIKTMWVGNVARVGESWKHEIF